MMEKLKHLARRSAHAAREQNPRRVAMFAAGRALRAIGGKPLHYTQRPALSDFDEVSEPTTDPSVMAASLGCPEADFKRYLSEYESISKGGQAAVLSRYPDACKSELNTQRVLYSLTRAHRPQIVLESGVADGFSSFAILAALAENGEGHLHSIDIRSDVGDVVPNELRDRWTVHITNDQALERSTKAIVASLPRIDFYYHDSGHSYLWQAFEYETIAPNITAGGVFLSDDVDWSYAFIDHCKISKQKPALMVEKRKVIGGYITPA